MRATWVITLVLGIISTMAVRGESGPHAEPTRKAPSKANAINVRPEVRADTRQMLAGVIHEMFLEPVAAALKIKGVDLRAEAEKSAERILQGDEAAGEELGRLALPLRTLSREEATNVFRALKRKYGISWYWYHVLRDQAVGMVVEQRLNGEDENFPAFVKYSTHKKGADYRRYLNLDNPEATPEQQAMARGILKAVAAGKGIDFGKGPIYDIPPSDISPAVIASVKARDARLVAEDRAQAARAKRSSDDSYQPPSRGYGPTPSILPNGDPLDISPQRSLGKDVFGF